MTGLAWNEFSQFDIDAFCKLIGPGVSVESTARGLLNTFEFGFTRCPSTVCDGLFPEYGRLTRFLDEKPVCPNCGGPSDLPDIVGCIEGLTLDTPADFFEMSPQQIKEMEARYLAVKPALRREDKPQVDEDEDDDFALGDVSRTTPKVDSSVRASAHSATPPSGRKSSESPFAGLFAHHPVDPENPLVQLGKSMEMAYENRKSGRASHLGTGAPKSSWPKGRR